MRTLPKRTGSILTGISIAFPFALALALYTTTLAPSLLGGDAGELQFTPAILALPHPSGYPIQIVINRLFILLLPLGSVAWRLNLLSALVMAAAVAIIGHTVARSSGSKWAGLAAAIGIASTPVLWSQAVLADKYALNGLLTALVLIVGQHFYTRPTASSLAHLSFVTGLALAHHRSLVLLAPLALGLVLLRGRFLLRRPAVWLWTAIAALAPFLAYLYLPWAAARGLPPGYPNGLDWGALFRYVFVDGSSGQIGLRPDWPGIDLYLSMLAKAFPIGWLVWLAVGLVLNWWKRSATRTWQILLLGGFLLTGYLAAVYENYDLPRRYVYFVPSYICLGLLIGEGIGGYLHWRPGWMSVGDGRQRWLQLLWLGLAFVPLIQLPQRWTTFRAEQYTEEPLGIWRQTLKSGQMADRLARGLALVQPKALIVGDWEQATPLWYAQQIEGQCADCRIFQGIDQLGKVITQASAENRPLYVARSINTTEGWSHPNSVGPLVWLAREPVQSLPTELTALNITFDDELCLAGYQWPLGEPTFRAGTVLPFTFVWQNTNDKALPAYAISLRLYAGEQEVWKADNPNPVLGMHPFSTFAPGEVVTDYYEVPLNPEWPPGAYRLAVVLYEVSAESGFRNAQAIDAAGNGLGEEVDVLDFQLRQ